MAVMGTPQGTERVVNWTDGPSDVDGDVKIHQRFYSEDTEAGVVVGKTLSILFTIDRPASEVWPHLKDFNPWQNEYGHYYSGVIGDLEGQTFRIGEGPDDLAGEHQYEVVRVIPQHVIFVLQPQMAAAGQSPDSHTIILNEHEGQSTVSIVMQHASLLADPAEEAETLIYYREMAEESQRKWRDIFIPALKQQVGDRDRT
jgi:hypothetical protein